MTTPPIPNTTASATTPAVFPRFPHLAAELRNQVWEDALADEVGPALVVYRTGCWQPRTSEGILLLEFRHDLLDADWCGFPVAFVNREAHRIALAWYRGQRRFTIRLRRGQDPVLVRSLDPATDALYVDPSQWVSVASGVTDRCVEPDLVNQTVDVMSSVQRVAMPEAFVRGHIAQVPEWSADMTCLRELLVVVDAPFDLKAADEDHGSVRSPWRFVSTLGDAFRWDPGHRRFALCSQRQQAGDGVVARLVQGSDEVASAFAKGYREGDIRDLVIRPVFAVQRQTEAQQACLGY